MKRTGILLLILALMAGLMAVATPASAAMNDGLLRGQTFTSVLSYDEAVFNGVDDLSDMVDAGLSGEADNVQVAIQSGGESGRAFHFSTTARGTQCVVGTGMGAVGAPEDWSGATDLVFWVDGSAFDEPVAFGLQIKINWGQNYQLSSEASVYVSNDGSTWMPWAPGYCHYGCVELPAGYKGWVRVALGDKTWTPYGAAGAGTAVDDTKVSAIFLGPNFDTDQGSNGATYIIDSIGLLSGDVIARPTAVPTTVPTKDGITEPSGISTSAPTTTPAPASPFTTVFGFEGFPTGLKLREEGDTEGYGTGGNDKAGVTYSAEVVAQGGAAGKALRWTCLAEGELASITVQANKDSSYISDWSGAKELWFYLDTTGYDPAGTGISLFLTANTIWVIKEGGKVTLYDIHTGKSSTSTITSHAFNAPKDFKGWVRLALNTDTFYVPEWAEQKATLNLENVSSITMGATTTKAAVGKAVYFDHFAVLNKTYATSDGFPVGGSGTDNGGKNSPVTGQAMPIAAMLTAACAVGSMLVLRRKYR